MCATIVSYFVQLLMLPCFIPASDTNIGLSLEGRHSSLLNLAPSSHYGSSRYNTDDDEDDDFGETVSKMMEAETKNEVRAREKEGVTGQKLKKKGSVEQEEEAEGTPSAERQGETKKAHAAEGEGKKKKEKSKEKKPKKINLEGGEGKTQPSKKKKSKAPSGNAEVEETTMETATMAASTMTTATMATTTGTMTDHKLVEGEVEIQDGPRPSQEMGEETVKMTFGVGLAKEDTHIHATGSPNQGVKETKGGEQRMSSPPSSAGVSKEKSPLVKRRMYVHQDDQHMDGSPVLTSKHLQEFHHQDREEDEGKKQTVSVTAKVSLAKVSAEQQAQVEEQVIVGQPMHAMNIVMETAPSPKEESSKMKKQSVQLVTAGLHQEPSYVAEVVMPKDAEVEEKVQQFSFIDSDEEEEGQGTGHAQQLHEKVKEVQSRKIQGQKGLTHELEAEEVSRQELHQPLPQEVAKPEAIAVQQESAERGSEGAEGSKEKEKKKKKKKKTSEQVDEEPTKSKGKKKKTAHGGEKKKSASKKPDEAHLDTSEATSTAPPWASGFSLPMFDMQMDVTTDPTLDKPPEESSLSADIFDELAKSSSVGDILRDIEDQIKEMETGLSESPSDVQPSSSQTAEPTHQVVQDQNQTSSFESTIQDLARELEKLGESESVSFNTSASSAVQPQRPQAPRRRVLQQETKVQQQVQSIIEENLVQKLVEVNRTLTDGGDSLSTWDLVQLQQQHNQLVQMVITQALSARETDLDTQALAQGIATALHQLDHFTISQIMAGINQGSEWSIHHI